MILFGDAEEKILKEAIWKQDRDTLKIEDCNKNGGTYFSVPNFFQSTGQATLSTLDQVLGSNS